MATTTTVVTVKEGQSIYDVCLMCYGSLNQLFTMMSENGINSIDDNLKGKKIIQKINPTQSMQFNSKPDPTGLVAAATPETTDTDLITHTIGAYNLRIDINMPGNSPANIHYLALGATTAHDGLESIKTQINAGTAVNGGLTATHNANKFSIIAPKAKGSIPNNKWAIALSGGGGVNINIALQSFVGGKFDNEA